VIVLALLGCISTHAREAETLKVVEHLVSFEDESVLYCASIAPTRVYVSTIRDPGTCGEVFAQKQDLYQYADSGRGFRVDSRELQTINFQRAIASFGEDEPVFLFISVPSTANSIAIKSAYSELASGTEVLAGPEVSISMFILTDVELGDLLHLETGSASTPIEIAHRGTGGASGFEEIGDVLRIGSPTPIPHAATE